MTILTTYGWEDYHLLDSGDGNRLERFGAYTLVRPDPQIIWKQKLDTKEWENADAVFDANKKTWIIKTSVPEKWLMRYGDISFYAKLSPFKHTGVFPEQILQWKFISSVIARRHDEAIISKKRLLRSARNDVKVLNLFGYTGIASLVAAKAGAAVTHIDASRPTIGWARENQLASDLQDKPIRWILDDALKFVQREIKRKKFYDGIIMDPPVYGHGPGGETWDFTESFPKLLALCRMLLVPKPLFVLVNAYAISASSLMLENVFQDYFHDLKGQIESGELALEEQSSKRLLSTGIFARWSAL